MAPAHFDNRQCVGIPALNSTLNEIGDGAILQGYEPGRSDQIGLARPDFRLPGFVVFVAQQGPEPFAFVRSARHDVANTQAIGNLLKGHRGKHRLHHVGNPVGELGPLLQYLRIVEFQVRFHVRQLVALVFRAANVVCAALGINKVVPAGVIEQRLALHGLA